MLDLFVCLFILDTCFKTPDVKGASKTSVVCRLLPLPERLRCSRISGESLICTGVFPAVLVCRFTWSNLEWRERLQHIDSVCLSSRNQVSELVVVEFECEEDTVLGASDLCSVSWLDSACWGDESDDTDELCVDHQITRGRVTVSVYNFWVA
ncbi:hypothetical protein Tco_0278202 [Tanacetum coccineum]